MYKIDDEKTYYMMLPPNLQNIDAECFSFALSVQLKKFVKLAGKLNVWGNLDNLDSKYYDLAAAGMNAQYYRTELPDEVKLDLLKHAYEMHRYAGTQTAIDTLLNIIFNSAEFTPWHEYGGKPYHFKVKTYDLITEDATTLLNNMLKKVKAARSIMDAIETGRHAYGEIQVGMVTTQAQRNPVIKEESCTGATE